MPLKGFQSLCSKNAIQVISRDQGHPQYHKGIENGSRCDYLLINEEKRRAYLIELKGSDLVKAVQQLETTERTLKQELSAYNLQYRIVANKCKTQEIRSSAYRKYQLRWKGKLVQKTGFIEENI